MNRARESSIDGAAGNRTRITLTDPGGWVYNDGRPFVGGFGVPTK